MSDQLVTLTTFHTASSADFYKMILDTEGIDCFLQDDLTNTAAPHYSLMTGGVKLMVKTSDAERAMAALNKHPEVDSSMFQLDQNALQQEAKASQMSSYLLYRISKNWPLFVTMLVLLGVVLFFFFQAAVTQGVLF